MMMKIFGFESVTTVECRQRNMDYGTLVVINFYLKNLFFLITRTRFNIFLKFFREIVL